MNIIEVARRLALLSLITPDWDSFRRKVCRYYSSHFNTPLHVVEYELDFYEVLLHYFESIFEELDPRERHEQLKLAIETTEDREKRLAQEEMEEEEFLRQAEEDERLKQEDINYKELAQKVKKDAEIKKIIDEKPDIDISFEKELDLDKPAF